MVHSGGVGSRKNVSAVRELQDRCSSLSAALQQGLEESQSTIQVLQEALSANFGQLEAMKLEANRKSRELEEVRQERELAAAVLLDSTAELSHTKAENTQSTSRMDGFMKIVGRLFVYRRNVQGFRSTT